MPISLIVAKFGNDIGYNICFVMTDVLILHTTPKKNKLTIVYYSDKMFFKITATSLK